MHSKLGSSLVAILLAAPPLLGQALPQADSSRWTLIDEAVGMVGGEAVVFSVVRPNYDRFRQQMAEQQRARNPGFREDDELRRWALLRALAERIKGIVLADHARTLGQDPAQLERRIQSFVDGIIEREKDEAGSNAAFFQRLERLGKDFGEYEREKREEALVYLVIQDALSSVENSTHLQISPRELRRYYRRNEAEFARPARAFGAQLALGAASESEKPEQRAEKAAKLGAALASATTLERVRALAEEHGARFEKVELSADAAAPAELRSFFFDAESAARSVSEPISLGSGLVLLWRSRLEPARQLPFTSREVQVRIREKLLLQRRLALQERLIAGLLRDAQIWPRDIDVFLRLAR